LNDANGRDDPQGDRARNNPTRIARCIDAIHRFFEKRRIEKYHESAADRASRSTARATWMIAALTVATICVGVSQYIIFDRQLAAMEDDQRPWVGMGFAGYPPDSPFQIQFINGGKSPAFDVSIMASASPYDDSVEPTIPVDRCLLNCKVAGVEMLPSVPYQFVLLRLSAGQDIPGWIIARVDYADANGHRHKTGVCLYHSPARHDLVACKRPNSNYAD
jgi:hypothetical protein